MLDKIFFNDIFVAKMTLLHEGTAMQQKTVLLFRQDFPGLKLPFHPRGTGINYFEAGELEERLPRPFCEICWVAEGACYFDSGETPVLVGEGESFFWLPGEPHRKRAWEHGRTIVYYATFDGPGAEDFLLSFGYGRGTQHSGGFPGELFECLARGMVSPSEKAYRALLPVYVELLVRMGGNTRDDYPADPLSEECLYRIQSECGNCDFNINGLADSMGIHRSTVNRLVRRATGQSPIAYLEACRLKRAFELLRTTRLPVREVAEQTGFRRCNYFCRLIRRATGLTPQEWRNHQTHS